MSAPLRRPNVVVILADDLGYGDLGCYNPESRIPTPNIDALAARGLRFTDAHAPAAVCTPSRYGLLTGRYAWRGNLPHGVLYGYEPPLIEPSRLTVASLLAGAGYRTAAIGKWHVGLGFQARPGASLRLERPLPWGEATREYEDGVDFRAGVTGGPTELGFDTFFGTAGCPTCQPPYAFLEGSTDRPTRFVELPSDYDDNPPFTGRPGRMAPSWRHEAADTTFAERAVEFVEACAAEPDHPFFLYLAADAPHEPCVEEVVPAFARGRSRAGPRGNLVWLFDWMVGSVVEALERTGALENTLLIVTSDNGALPGDRLSEVESMPSAGAGDAAASDPVAESAGMPEPAGMPGRDDVDPPGMAGYRTWGHRANGDWRGYKSHIWEGGHREPLIVHWPGRVPEGAETGALACLGDLLASVAGLLDIRLPKGAGVDSADLSDVMLGRDDTGPRRTLVHHSVRGAFAVRHEGFKVVFGTEGSGGWPPPADGFPSPTVLDPRFPAPEVLGRVRAGDGVPGQLYDLRSDPFERENLWNERFDIVAELAGLLAGFRRDGRSIPWRGAW